MNTPTASIAQQIEALLKPYNRPDGPGVVVGVAQHGRTLYRAAFGQANVEHRVAMTPTTRVSICSVTKHMTCAAVLKLAAEGRLSVDDQVGRWVPEVQPPTRRPTLAQLMKHTGGVRCHFDAAAFNGITPHPVGVPMQMMRAQQTVNFESGQGMMYCNGGYYLLSLAVERASGKPFGRYLEEELFAPLRMDATVAPKTWWPLLDHAATYYLPHEGGGWRHGIGFEGEAFGSGAVLSSLDDMLRWAQHLRESSGPVSLAALTQAADNPQPQLDGLYKYGLTDQRWRGTRLVEHSGGAVGASCHLLIAPDHALDLFIFFNSDEPAQILGRQVAAVVLAGSLEAELPQRPIPVAEHPRLPGQYIDDEQGLVVGFGDMGGQLGISMFGGPTVPFLFPHVPMADELPFMVPTALGPRHFRMAPGGEGVQWLDAGRWRTLRPIELAPAPLQTLLAGLSGAAYVSAEAIATLRFREDDGALLMHSCGDFGTWKFHPQSLTRDMLAFSFYRGSASWLARLRWKGDIVEAIEMSSTRTRGLVFRRSAEGGS